MQWGHKVLFPCRTTRKSYNRNVCSVAGFHSGCGIPPRKLPFPTPYNCIFFLERLNQNSSAIPILELGKKTHEFCPLTNILVILLRDILVLLSDLGECLVDWYKIPFSMYYIQSQTLEKNCLPILSGT